MNRGTFSYHFKCIFFVFVPVWLFSHLQRSVRGAASLLRCCDSRLVHRTAGPHRVSSGPNAADTSSSSKNKKSLLTHSCWGERIARLKPNRNRPAAPPPACGQQRWCRFQLDQELPAASSASSPLRWKGSGERRPVVDTLCRGVQTVLTLHSSQQLGATPVQLGVKSALVSLKALRTSRTFSTAGRNRCVCRFLLLYFIKLGRQLFNLLLFLLKEMEIILLWLYF